MPRIRTSRTRAPPAGFEDIEPILEEYETKMRDAENESQEGKRKAEGVWGILRVTHLRSRYIYDLYYKREAISWELYDWLLEQGYADAAYVNVLTQPDCQVEAHRLREAVLCAVHPVARTCILLMQDMNYEGSTCICRVPRAQLRPGTFVELSRLQLLRLMKRPFFAIDSTSTTCFDMDDDARPGSAAGQAKAEATSRPTSPGGAMPKPVALQSNEQWLMRVNRDGLPICRDLHGLFTTVIISLCDRWPDWRYPLAFVLPALVQRMQALQFVQIVRDSANGMQNMLSLSQTKTSFIMSSETAMRICQAFIDAALLQRTESTEDEVYAPSPKGLHLIDRFVTRHGIATRSVSNLLNLHELCDKLLFLERDEQDDVLLSDAVVRIVFHRMVGLSPRRTESNALGMALQATHARDSTGQMYETAHFASSEALAWLVNYTTLVSVDEAIVLGAHMVRLGWLEPETGLPPTRSNRVATVRVDASLRVDGAECEGTFVEGETYHITELGATVAWKVDWVEQPTTMFAAEQRPPTSFFQGNPTNVMRSVSPRLDEFEGYSSYVDANPPPSVSPDLAPPSRANSTRITPASRESAPEAAKEAPAPPTAKPSYTLQDVLTQAPLRRAYASFLQQRGEGTWLRLWCHIEWFRSDCRLATSGALTSVSDDDPTSALPSEVVQPTNARPTGMDGPQMRTSLRGLLVESAHVRLGPYVDDDVLADVHAPFAAAWRRFVDAPPLVDAVPSAEAARKSEQTLAKLLVQCAAAQKHAKAQLQSPLLTPFLEALARGDVSL